MIPLCQSLHEEFAKLAAAQAEARTVLDEYWQNGGDEKKLGESIKKVEKALDDYEQFCRTQVQLRDGRAIWLPDYIAVLNIAELNEIEAEEIFGKIPQDGIGASSLRIEKLDLSELRITRLDRSLYPLVGLRELDLCGCTGVMTLEGCLDRNTVLENLFLNGCTGLTTLEGCLDKNTALATLNLWGCIDLTTLKGCLDNNPLLEELNLGCCTGLTTLEGCIDKNTALKYLWLHDCIGLTTLERCLEKNEMLESLDLNGCVRLNTLEGCLNRNAALRQIDLSGCSALKTLEGCFENKPSLKTVALGSSGVPEDEIAKFRASYPKIRFETE